MVDKHYSEKALNLKRNLESLYFVKAVYLESEQTITAGNFNDTLIFNKNTERYSANIKVDKKHTCKLSIAVSGRPNPKLEKKMWKYF